MQEKDQEVEYIYATPDDLGYKDRGIMKWMGIMPTEQREYIYEQAQAFKRGERKVLEKESEEKIGEKLFYAHTNKQIVSIQQDIKRDGKFIEPTVGLVQGFHDQYVVLETKQGRKGMEMHNIRYVERVAYDKWMEQRSPEK